LFAEFSHKLTANLLNLIFFGPVIGFLLFSGQFQDLYLTLRRPFISWSPEEPAVSLVALNERTVYLWSGQSPDNNTHTPRSLLAELVSALGAAGASVIVIDILLEDAGEGDDALQQAATEHGAVIVAERVLQPLADQPLFSIPTQPSFQDAVTPAITSMTEEDTSFLSQGRRRVRSAPLIRTLTRTLPGPAWSELSSTADPEADLSGLWMANATETVPAMALAAAWKYHHPEEPFGNLSVQLSDGCIPECSQTTADVGLPGPPHLLHHEHDILFLTGAREEPYPIIDATELLRAWLLTQRGLPTGDTDWTADIKDRVVVVGYVSGDWSDRFITARQFPLYIRGDTTGVQLQVELLANLLQGRRIRSPRLPPVAKAIGGLVLGMLAVAGIRHRSPLEQLIILLVVSFAVSLGGLLLFSLTDGFVATPRFFILGIMLSMLAWHNWLWLSTKRP